MSIVLWVHLVFRSYAMMRQLPQGGSTVRGLTLQFGLSVCAVLIAQILDPIRSLYTGDRPQQH